MSYEKLNPINLLKKYLSRLSEFSIIVSTIQVPNTNWTGGETKDNKRVCYYIHESDVREIPMVYIRAEIFPITDEQNKYDVIGYFVEEPSINVTISRYTKYNNRKKFPVNALKYFDERHSLIDTICIVKNTDLDEIKLIYDRTGYGNIAQQFMDKYRHWSRIKLASRITGNPEALKQMGYFEPQEDQDDRKLIEKLRAEKYEPPPPGGPFSFGKRNNFTLRKLNMDIKYIKSLYI